MECSLQVQEVLHSRKPSIRMTYSLKWKRWGVQSNMDPVVVPIPRILDTMLLLNQAGLVFNSLKVHLAAILAYHALVFFLLSDGMENSSKNLLHSYLLVRGLTHKWDLNILLLKLVESLLLNHCWSAH